MRRSSTATSAIAGTAAIWDATYVNSDYDAAIPLLDVTRRDHNLSANVAALYLINANWSVRAEFQYARNNSNLELYEYTRRAGALKLRYEFK